MYLLHHDETCIDEVHVMMRDRRRILRILRIVWSGPGFRPIVKP